MLTPIKVVVPVSKSEKVDPRTKEIAGLKWTVL